MQAQVISVKHAADRREHIRTEFARVGVPFAFFDAVTPVDADVWRRRLGLERHHFGVLSPVEVACFLSQVALWQKMVDESIPYMAIFEDDVYLAGDAAAFLQDEAWRSLGVDIVKIETTRGALRLGAPCMQVMGRQISRLAERHMGMGGYILSLRGAESLLRLIHSQTRPMPGVDHLVFEQYLWQGELAVYQLHPAICIQECILHADRITMPGDLEGARQLRRSRSQFSDLSWARCLRVAGYVFWQAIEMVKSGRRAKVEFR